MSDECDRGAPIDRESWQSEARADETDDGTDETVSARDSDARPSSRFEHEGIVCELGRENETPCGSVRLPPSVDRLHLSWELDPPRRFGYGPDPDGVDPREAAMAVAGLAAQVAERARSSPE